MQALYYFISRKDIKAKDGSMWYKYWFYDPNDSGECISFFTDKYFAFEFGTPVLCHLSMSTGKDGSVRVNIKSMEERRK